MTEEMTEKEKMLAGQLYDPTDEELVQLREDAHGWNVDYNMTKETEEELREAIMDKLVPNRGEDVYFQGPVSFDYGVFTTIGPRTYFNFNFTCLRPGDHRIRRIFRTQRVHLYCHASHSLAGAGPAAPGGRIVL